MFKKVRGNQSKPEPIQAPTPARQQPAPTRAPSTPAPVAAPLAATRQAPQSSTPAPSTPRQVAPAPSGRNVLSSDVEIKGSIKFSNDLVVDGKIEGHILSDGSLTVGENARITAEIKTRSVVIYGKVYGNIEVTHTVELKADCELVGDIKAASLSIEPGAIFVGKSTVGKPTTQQAPAKTEAGKPAQPQQPVKAQQPVKKEEQPQLPKKADIQNEQKPSAGNKAPQSMGKAPQSPKKG